MKVRGPPHHLSNATKQERKGAAEASPPRYCLDDRDDRCFNGWLRVRTRRWLAADAGISFLTRANTTLFVFASSSGCD